MKIISLICILILNFSAISYSQSGVPTVIKSNPESHAKLLQAKLNLTDIQTNQVIAIYQASDPETNELDMDDALPSLKITSEKILAILNSQQTIIFQKLLTERKPPEIKNLKNIISKKKQNP